MCGVGFGFVFEYKRQESPRGREYWSFSWVRKSFVRMLPWTSMAASAAACATVLTTIAETEGAKPATKAAMLMTLNMGDALLDECVAFWNKRNGS